MTEEKYRNSNKTAWYMVIAFIILFILVSLITCSNKFDGKTRYAICTSSGCDTVTEYQHYPALGLTKYIHKGDTIIAYHAQINPVK